MKFGPHRRVRKRPEFQQIQKSGRRVTTPHFVWVISSVDSQEAPPRLGITASKRVGNSPRRSRLKRIVRAAFQTLEGMVPNGHDLVVICVKDELTLNRETVVQEWEAASKRVQKVLRQLESRER